MQPLDDVAVVHDLVAHIDRGPVLLQGPLDDLDRSFDPRTEPAGLRQHNSHHRVSSPRSLLLPAGNAISRAIVSYPCHNSRITRNAAPPKPQAGAAGQGRRGNFRLRRLRSFC
jgi:hypothetical protein